MDGAFDIGKVPDAPWPKDMDSLETRTLRDLKLRPALGALVKIGPNQWRFAGVDTGIRMSMEAGRPTLWQRFKRRFMPKRWERECDEAMAQVYGDAADACDRVAAVGGIDRSPQDFWQNAGSRHGITARNRSRG